MKYIVEADVNKDELKETLDLFDFGKITVTECQEPADLVPMVRTGVLKANVQKLIVEMYPNPLVDIKRRVAFPDNVADLFEDVKNEIDLSKVKDGDIVVVNFDKEPVVGFYFYNDGKPILKPYVNAQNRIYITPENVKSVRIIERGE